MPDTRVPAAATGLPRPINHGARIDRAILELNMAIHQRYGSAVSVDVSALDRLVLANAQRVREFRRNLKGVPVQEVARRLFGRAA